MKEETKNLIIIVVFGLVCGFIGAATCTAIELVLK
jgi:hypothetical protein